MGTTFFLRQEKNNMSEKRVFLVRPQAHIRGQMSAATWTKLPADGLRKK